ncbi:MAG: T9SS type A sorting domain-containing protein [Bacteroidales bacterium]
MQNYKITVLLITVFISLNIYSQSDTTIKEGYVNIATLKVDYNSYDFIGGDISYYSCPNCADDSIPFTINYHQPCDFGGITFKLSSLQDTVFDATIIWMGTGQIYQPDGFSTKPPFTNTNSNVNKPKDLRYINADGSPATDTNFINKADSAWNAIDSLEITNLFAEKDYKAAIYLYPPAVGAFNPDVAKWIVFLYHHDQPNAIDTFSESGQLKISPNPSKGEVRISWNGADSQRISYKIVNSRGELIDSGEYSGDGHKLNLSFLKPGLYILKLTGKKKTVSQKLIIE